MHVEAIIAALIGAVGGTGGARAWRVLSRTEKDEAVAEYYRRVIRSLQEENEKLRERVQGLNNQVDSLTGRVRALEATGADG